MSRAADIIHLPLINWQRELKVTAKTDDDIIMAVEHREYPVYGVQFHPESILTEEGKKIVRNFLKIAEEKNRN